MCRILEGASPKVPLRLGKRMARKDFKKVT
jgi:hypothetical protein